MNKSVVRFLLCCLSCTVSPARGQEASPAPARFQLREIFELEYASDPRISPDGKRIVYVRHFLDAMTDRNRSNLWIINSDGSGHRPLTDGDGDDSSPRWSPDGQRLLYLSRSGGSQQLYLRWMDSGQTARLTHLRRAPANLSWSPDGHWIAFTMLVPKAREPYVRLPAKPRGAKWARPPRIIRTLHYRSDGRGYLEEGYSHIFLLPAEGGTPRQLTSGDFNHEGPLTWTPDGHYLLFSANRHPDWEYDPLNSEVYQLSLADLGLRALTDRKGPDSNPVISPDGRRIAYLGFDDHLQGYQVRRLYLMQRDGSDPHLLTGDLDRDVTHPVWSSDGKGLYFQYDEEGNTHVAYLSLTGGIGTLARDVGGLSLGRPYSAGSFTASREGHFAFTQTRPDHPADVAVGDRQGKPTRRLTRLNDDLFSHKRLGRVEEIRFPSSFDGRMIQGWLVTPPDFDPSRRYPLILEIHGGPFANYGDRFTAEIQLYAAAGYVVLYCNPRGSTSYGQEFGNLIHHNYPGQDYDDLMSGVDAVLARGFVDPERLFVTGGSGGGVLSAWIVGKTDRFRAAVVAKPVINWYSFVLTSDAYNFFYKYWFPGLPWDHAEHYMRRSPISLAGHVKTPTMLMTGEVDYRTPSSEAEQFYQALKLRKVDAALVRIPQASHGITRRPSYFVAKVAYILQWFKEHGGQ